MSQDDIFSSFCNVQSLFLYISFYWNAYERTHEYNVANVMNNEDDNAVYGSFSTAHWLLPPAARKQSVFMFLCSNEVLRGDACDFKINIHKLGSFF